MNTTTFMEIANSLDVRTTISQDILDNFNIQSAKFAIKTFALMYYSLMNLMERIMDRKLRISNFH
jgi:hypothetical protein